MPISLLIWVACDAKPCRVYGVPRRVQLRVAAVGVVEMPTLLCQSCGLHVKQLPEGEDVPKNTVHGGPTNASVDLAVTEPKEGEQSSPGSSSSASPEKPESSDSSKSPDLGPPARTTVSRSGKGQTGTSTARGTAGARKGAA